MVQGAAAKPDGYRPDLVAGGATERRAIQNLAGALGDRAGFPVSIAGASSPNGWATAVPAMVVVVVEQLAIK